MSNVGQRGNRCFTQKDDCNVFFALACSCYLKCIDSCNCKMTYEDKGWKNDCLDKKRLLTVKSVLNIGIECNK